jgi:membrane AbrB-like protein
VIPPVKGAVRPYYWLFLIGTLASGLFYMIHFPAALLLGATFGVASIQLISKKPFKRPPQSLYNYTQIMMGAIIGTSFTISSLQAVGTLTLPLFALTVLTLTTSVILGYVFSKVFHWDFMTGFMAVLPGGLSTIIIIADDYDADVIIISSLQTARVITAVMIIPLIYQWLL